VTFNIQLLKLAIHPDGPKTTARIDFDSFVIVKIKLWVLFLYCHLVDSSIWQWTIRRQHIYFCIKNIVFEKAFAVPLYHYYNWCPHKGVIALSRVLKPTTSRPPSNMPTAQSDL